MTDIILLYSYVDEAQDNLLIDALGTFGATANGRRSLTISRAVLRTLCRNPNGMFWAGDTAQTISVGSAFRFNDLKSFLYRYEEVCLDVPCSRALFRSALTEYPT